MRTEKITSELIDYIVEKIVREIQPEKIILLARILNDFTEAGRYPSDLPSTALARRRLMKPSRCPKNCRIRFRQDVVNLKAPNKSKIIERRSAIDAVNLVILSREYHIPDPDLS